MNVFFNVGRWWIALAEHGRRSSKRNFLTANGSDWHNHSGYWSPISGGVGGWAIALLGASYGLSRLPIAHALRFLWFPVLLAPAQETLSRKIEIRLYEACDK